MHEAVSDVLDLRMRESDGLSRMVVVSLVAHAVAACRGRADAGRLARSEERKEKSNADVHLARRGASGPNAGGMTQLSGRVRFRQSRRPRPKPRVETPPAAKAPEMTIPDPSLEAQAADVGQNREAGGQVGEPQADDGAEVKTAMRGSTPGAAPIPVRRAVDRRRAGPAVCRSTSATSAAPSTSPR